MSNNIRTQIGGKFSVNDTGIFRLKQKLVQAGMIVDFPVGDTIVGMYNNIPVTFVPTAEMTFYDVELAFFSAIRTNPIHVVHNKFGRRRGYLGESASIEIAYAILHAKPIVLLYRPKFSATVPQSVQRLIRRNEDRYCVKRIDSSSIEELSACLLEVSRRSIITYDLCDTETEVGVMDAIARLFDSYKAK